jgi:hypothetical protein
MYFLPSEIGGLGELSWGLIYLFAFLFYHRILSRLFSIDPNVAKVEDVADLRRRGCSCSTLPRTLDNAPEAHKRRSKIPRQRGDAVSSTFPEGK